MSKKNYRILILEQDAIRAVAYEYIELDLKRHGLTIEVKGPTHRYTYPTWHLVRCGMPLHYYSEFYAGPPLPVPILTVYDPGGIRQENAIFREIARRERTRSTEEKYRCIAK